MAGYALALRRRAQAGIAMQIVHLQDPRLPPRLLMRYRAAHDPGAAGMSL